MIWALPPTTTSWKKSSRLRSSHCAPPPTWMHPVWMPGTATNEATFGVDSAAETCARSTLHVALTKFGSPVAFAPYQAMSTMPGLMTSIVGNTAVPDFDTVTGVDHVAPWSLLVASLM